MKIVRFLMVLAALTICTSLLSSCSGCKEEFSCLKCPLGTRCDIDNKICVEETNYNDGTGSDEDSEKSCVPGEQQICPYEGPEGTEGVGPCRAAVRTCQNDKTWGKCEDGYDPVREIGKLCSNGIDDDCNGVVDDGIDFDEDGYGACSDCCENESDCDGFDPKLIHPGAYEMIGDGIDNNCDGQIDEPTSCDGEDEPLMVDDYDGNAIKLAHALGVCGDNLVSAKISLTAEPIMEYIADELCVEDIGSPTEDQLYEEMAKYKLNRMSRPMPYYDDTYQTFAAEPRFGSKILPLNGSKIAILSTGSWNKAKRDVRCTKLSSGDMKTASRAPSDWINMMPNCEIPKSPSCGGAIVEDGLTNQCDGKEIPPVQDPIMLTLQVKVPENARAFQFNLFFFSNEYSETTVCDKRNFNDFFVTLLDSEYNEKPDDEFRNPYDKNLAKDEKGNFVGVDLAPDGLFQVCDPEEELEYASNCIQGDALLTGTHFRGGTGWLTIRGNVKSGEIITLRFALWEQGTVSYGPDHSYDSTVLLDGFRWLPKPAKAGTYPQ